MDRFEESVAIFNKQIELFPEDTLLHNNISWCYSTGARVIDPEKALRHAREALLGHPYSATVWNTLAEAYYISGGYEKALRASQHAVDLLSETNASEEQRESYSAQILKIIRTQEAMKMSEGLGGSK